MLLEVLHTTTFTYSRKIAETVMEVRSRPLDGLGQRCVEFDLQVTPRATVGSYRDGFGNFVHYFNHLAPHDTVTVVGKAIVETGLATAGPADGFPEDFLHFRSPVLSVGGIRHLAKRLAPKDPESAEEVQVALDAIAIHINERFLYQPQTTNVYTAVDEVLKLKQGVCQDFAHLFVAVARAMTIPARYVSGYINAGVGLIGTGATHAWAEALVPGTGWVGYDPTNPVRAGEHHVRVAVGRDYHDVPPTRGVYLGAAEEAMEVTVQTRVL
jgi:transglutaminase-like putative cysteine protease